MVRNNCRSLINRQLMSQIPLTCIFVSRIRRPCWGKPVQPGTTCHSITGPQGLKVLVIEALVLLSSVCQIKEGTWHNMMDMPLSSIRPCHAKCKLGSKVLPKFRNGAPQWLCCGTAYLLEFYSWVAYGEGIYTVNSTLVGRLQTLESQLCLPVHAKLNTIW